MVFAVALVTTLFIGFVVVPAITGKTLIELINPPKAGNIYGFIVKDVNGDTLEIEVNEFDVLEQAAQMNESGARKWVGGKLVTYENEWGFRFHPDTIIIADVVAEGLQTNLRFIKEDFDYWSRFSRVYIWAEVTHLTVEHVVGKE